MHVKAQYEEGFFRKFLYIALVCFGYSVWCLYDGWIAYPAKLVQANVYHGELANLEGDERDKAWLDRTTAEGWPTHVPKTPEEIKNDIVQQYVQIAVCLVIAIPLLLKYLLARGTFIEATEAEIRPSWYKTAIPFAAIAKIDKARWAKKGIAKLFYTIDGRTKIFTMDDFKFAQAEMAQIMLRAERDLPDSAIIGPRQSELPGDEDDEQDGDAGGNNDTEGDSDEPIEKKIR
ncbi:MAG: hypothetical protein JNL67_10245 [Planctomycetaceae bacterium]|nr:hypothetical protein [Planctomycetaceae bacterium]